VFDDIRWSAGMKEAWDQLARDPRMRLAVDLLEIGVCVTTRRTGDQATFRTRPLLL